MKIRIFFFSLATVFGFLFFSDKSYSSIFENYEDSIADSFSAENRLTLSLYNTDVPFRFIVVEKSKQKLMVFEQQQSLELIKTFICATGENPGKKNISGDSKTPEGVYFITEIYEDKKITVFGSRAYHLDYPNAFDKQAGHLGNGIFIHGTNKTLIPFSTNGCITLTNADLDELSSYLSVNTIPIIVLENLTTPLIGTDLKMSKDDDRFNEILNELSFTPRYFSTDNVENLSLITLGSQAIASISYKVYDGEFLEYRYHKRAYLAAAVTKNWRTIFAVENQDTFPTLLALHPVKNPLAEPNALSQVEPNTPLEPVAVSVGPVEPAEPVEPVEPVVARVDMGEELLIFIEKWKTAWAAKDIDTYIACYSPTFKNGRLDRKSWRKKKSYLNNKYNFIKVAISDISIEWTDAGANVSFFQEYRSDKYQSTGTKRLQLVNKDDKWLIQKEIM